jgi:hypothetical protein
MTTEERNELLSIMSDMYKDAYGFRNRSIKYQAFTDAELLAEVDNLQKIIEDDIRHEQEVSERSIFQLEGRIQTLIESGANDRQTAIRWIIQSFKEDEQFYSFEFSLREIGISYNDAHAYKEEFKEVLLQVA